MVEKGVDSPIRTAGGVAHVGHAPLTNATTVAFFIPEASQAADPHNDAKKLPKRSTPMARECHVPSQGWRVWCLNSAGGIDSGRSTRWCCCFYEEVRRKRQKHHLGCNGGGDNMWDSKGGGFVYSTPRCSPPVTVVAWRGTDPGREEVAWL